MRNSCMEGAGSNYGIETFLLGQGRDREERRRRGSHTGGQESKWGDRRRAPLA